MATTTNYSWTTPDDTALVKDGAAAIRSLGTAIDSTVFTNAGNAIAKTIVDAKGDLIVATAADTVARLASSASNGDLLTVDTSTATGLKWSAPAGGGKILQVVNATTTTQTQIASTSMTDTTITATITPTLATSKILVLITGQYEAYRNTTENDINARIMRGATAIASWTGGYFGGIHAGNTGSGVWLYMTGTWTWLDSPATTSATTYKLQSCVQSTANSGVVTWQIGSVPSGITLLEVGV
jgi:hypothetical protein